jgi:hypothetical protein
MLNWSMINQTKFVLINLRQVMVERRWLFI